MGILIIQSWRFAADWPALLQLVQLQLQQLLQLQQQQEVEQDQPEQKQHVLLLSAESLGLQLSAPSC